MYIENKKCNSIVKNKWKILSLLFVALFSVVVQITPVYARGLDSVFEPHPTTDVQAAEAEFKALFNDLYSGVIGLSTVVAVSGISYCCMIRMCSRNTKTIDEATGWIGRIIKAWICLMLVSLFISVGFDFITTAGINTYLPWR